ncbi:hypothetical protein GF391_01190 [Candidatus Uhrbacteria bacterium]|nr:hypothetical protein [Candidatus Uhrbacteria bacterium]
MNVREFKDLVLQRAGVGTHWDFLLPEFSQGEFQGPRNVLWEKLNHIGSRVYLVQRDDSVLDVDAQVVLEPEEEAELLRELEQCL